MESHSFREIHERCLTLKTEIEKIRQENHDLRLRNQEPFSKANEIPKTNKIDEDPQFLSHSLLLQALANANKLDESLDLKGTFELLPKQTKRNEELHKIIDDKNRIIHDLQMNIQSLNLMKSGQSPSSETKFDYTHDVKHDDACSRPKRPIKRTFPPTWDKTTTSNRFEYLSDSAVDKIKDDHVADADILDMQIQNVKLKCQVKLLQKRVAESTPNKTAGDCNNKRLSDTYLAKSHKPTDRTNERVDHSPRSNSHAQSNESKGKTVTIMGDSMISYQDEKLHSNRRRTVKVRSYPGATSEDLIYFRKPIARRQPDVIIIHVGTNNLRIKDEKEIAKNIATIKNAISQISPDTKTLISVIIQRLDKINESLNDKVFIVNHELMQLLPKHDLIDNNNISRDCIGNKGLHLNRLGRRHLA